MLHEARGEAQQAIHYYERTLQYMDANPDDFEESSREPFRTAIERLVRPIVERCRGPVEQALRDSGMQPEDIDRVIFVGGPTRMPILQQFFEEIFECSAEKGVDPMECVASGAAIQAGVLTGGVGGIVLVDVTPLSLGEFNLDGLAPAPRGVPKVDVTFDADSNGILNVTAKDTAPGKFQSIRITGSTRLSEDQRERVVKDAERYVDEDKKRREEATR